MIENYNYDEFVPDKFMPLMRFDESPAIGTKAPDFPLWYTDDRSKTTLSAILGENKFTIVEFGSFT